MRKYSKERGGVFGGQRTKFSKNNRARMKTRMLYPIASRRFAAKMRSSLGARCWELCKSDYWRFYRGNCTSVEEN